MATRILILFAIAGIVIAPSSAQVLMQGTSGANSFSGTASFPPAHLIGPTVAGAPYSGEEVNENVHILADGTRITQKNMMRKVWRDSEGRIRTERPLGMGPNETSMPLIIEIMDPIAGFQYTLDTQKKVTHRQVLPPSRGVGVGTVAAAPRYRAGPTLTMAPRPRSQWAEEVEAARASSARRSPLRPARRPARRSIQQCARDL